MAKRWSDEQKSHMRRTRGTRGPRDSKSGTCTATRGRRCGGHKRDGHCALPGEVSDGAIKLAHSQGWDDADGEVSRGHSSRAIDEGPNRLKTASAGFQKLIGQLRRKTATGRRRGTDSREVCSGGYSQPGACATSRVQRNRRIRGPYVRWCGRTAEGDLRLLPDWRGSSRRGIVIPMRGW